MNRLLRVLVLALLYGGAAAFVLWLLWDGLTAYLLNRIMM